ncbi:hypothetical protein NPIL_26671 [Nephila pilipes]|uniref:Uncharacterized protein n=1 Tax=Nephila pilipes TaxID=299642 RepID=A0A8X6NBC9_NEPPI|nr:hypothetical protein NPIL_26671 [Nephila pilipes]
MFCSPLRILIFTTAAGSSDNNRYLWDIGLLETNHENQQLEHSLPPLDTNNERDTTPGRWVKSSEDTVVDERPNVSVNELQSAETQDSSDQSS